MSCCVDTTYAESEDEDCVDDDDDGAAAQASCVFSRRAVLLQMEERCGLDGDAFTNGCLPRVVGLDGAIVRVSYAVSSRSVSAMDMALAAVTLEVGMVGMVSAGTRLR